MRARLCLIGPSWVWRPPTSAADRSAASRSESRRPSQRWRQRIRTNRFDKSVKSKSAHFHMACLAEQCQELRIGATQMRTTDRDDLIEWSHVKMRRQIPVGTRPHSIGRRSNTAMAVHRRLNSRSHLRIRSANRVWNAPASVMAIENSRSGSPYWQTVLWGLHCGATRISRSAFVRRPPASVDTASQSRVAGSFPHHESAMQAPTSCHRTRSVDTLPRARSRLPPGACGLGASAQRARRAVSHACENHRHIAG